MSQHLVLTIRLHDRRYHGAPTTEWPPAPGRVFQALVAGAARGNELPVAAARSLEWLESLAPPTIAAPRARLGNRVDLFVPNNDLDAVGGDPSNIGEIRTKKAVRPQLLEGDEPLVYAWAVTDDSAHAAAVVEAANDLYQLGRGVDMAWAVGELLDDDALTSRLAEHRGTLHRPQTGAGDHPLPCPGQGSLASLTARHHAGAQKLRTEGEGKAARTLFTQPPKPRFRPVSYASGTPSVVYELKDLEDTSRFWAWPLARVSSLVERLRDAAAERLCAALPKEAEVIERCLIGRKADGRDAAPITQRIRIVPLPSIGHEHVSRGIRRVLIEVPSACPLHAKDVHWAFSGLAPANDETGEVAPFILTQSDDRSMLGHYERKSTIWRSVTAVALPETARRRRIEPSRQREEAKSALERIEEERRAASAVLTALRHAGIRGPTVAVKVQREPFERRGVRAEAFADGARFVKERLWHVEVSFPDAIAGPLVIGDGRFLGLGVLAPVSDSPGIFALEVTGDEPGHIDGVALASALRRAVMSRVQGTLGRRPLGRFFSGHEEDGKPAKSDDSSHLAYHWDPAHRRLLVISPHLLDHRPPTSEESGELQVLATALDGFVELLAGRAGRHNLKRGVLNEADWYLGCSRVWQSVCPYTVTRHRNRPSAAEALIEDVLAECTRRGLPDPEVTVLRSRGVAGRGLEGHLRLTFPVAVAGPLALGRTRYLGGGLFSRVTST